jgi:hypothetical protein
MTPGCACPPVLPVCAVAARRERILASADWNGIDYIEVEDDQRSLCVHLFGRIPAVIGAANIRICGGRRIRDIAITGVEIHHTDDPELDDCLRVYVDRAGDFSTYCLCIGVAAKPAADECGFVKPGETGPDWTPFPGFDLRYSCAEFSFKAGCPSVLDCKTDTACVAPPLLAPAIDYLAKDYASFRRLLLDRLAVTLSDWHERHVPDIGIALVEVLAYVADRLSYFQDAVATEAYLDTARRRISVRRHLRLVDYLMHEGCNARAFVTLSSSADGDIDLGSMDFAALSAHQPASNLIRPSDLDRLPANESMVFEPLLPPRGATFTVIAAQSEIQFYTWGSLECCLPRAATRATLLDVEPAPVPPDGPAPPAATTSKKCSDGRVGKLGLRVGDLLIFEEVLGPTTGSAADADPRHRHTVRLTAVYADRDPLFNKPLIEIEWGLEDALPFPLCLSSKTRDCVRLEGVSVARGNVILVDHGRTRSDAIGCVGWTETPGPCACDGSVQERLRVANPFAASLPRAPLAFAQPVPAAASAQALLMQDPRSALPQIMLVATGDEPQQKATTETWQPRRDLLGSAADAADYVVEIDDDMVAHLRFGDGKHGRRPEAGTCFTATYRVGNGTAGNVGADSIRCIVANGLPIADLAARNPLPAACGTPPEPVREATLFGPGAIRRRLARAVVAEDYATIAHGNPALQGAAATLAWTGSWYEVDVAVDPLRSDEPSATLLASIDRMLEPYRRVGHDLAVVAARYVPLAVELTVCVEDGYLAARVLAALRDRFGARQGADGSKGFFHPDNLTFGQDIAVSRLVAAAQSIDGVRHAEVTRLERAPPRPGALDPTAIVAGVLQLAPDEIAQVDNDPTYPEHGTLSFVLRGGR